MTFNPNKMLSSDRIILRAPEPEDLETLYRWENDTTLWQYGNTLNPLSRFALREFIASCSENIFETKQTRMMVIDKANNQPIGAVDLYELDPFHQRIGIGVFIDVEFQKQGFAKEALGLMKNYCFDLLQLHQLFAHIPENNRASLALFKSSGFQESGVLKGWIRWNDKHENVVVMQCFKG
ncbi:MAG: GNAT family N-acetyltransferase [Bacteroidales bacterium]